METTLLLHSLAAMVSTQQMEVLRLRAQGASLRSIAAQQKMTIKQIHELLEDVRSILHKLCNEC